jgi:L-ascorbate metabolism protein UlaG (beta-lactamase superfamily)
MTASVTFIGTATTLLRLGDFTILTDPNFLHVGEPAYLGYGLWSRRRTNPALDFEQLPPLDGVLLSHLHGDHFDRIASKSIPSALPIITTPQASRQLLRRGFTAAVPLSTWHSEVWQRGTHVLRVTSVPAQHGPAVVHRALPETMGSIVDLDEHGVRTLRLYITGDTLYRQRLAEIARRFPDIDAILLHLGGTRILGVLLTMDGQQGAELLSTFPTGVALPVHYDDYPVFRSPLTDFLAAANASGFEERVRLLPKGEAVPLVGGEQRV